jgi:regulator of replication initiation timing
MPNIADQVKTLEAEHDKLLTKVAELKAENAELKAENAELKAENARPTPRSTQYGPYVCDDPTSAHNW